MTSYSKAMTKLEISIKEEQGKYEVTWWENTCDDDLPTKLDEQLQIAVKEVLDQYNSKQADEVVEEPYSDQVKLYGRI